MILYIIPTYRDILLRTVFTWRDQLSDSSMITPRNLASDLRSMGVLEIIKESGKSTERDLENIIYLVFFRFKASPLALTHTNKLLIRSFNWLLIDSIVSAVIIILASSAYKINFAKQAVSGMSLIYIMNSNVPSILPCGTPNSMVLVVEHDPLIVTNCFLLLK